MRPLGLVFLCCCAAPVLAAPPTSATLLPPSTLQHVRVADFAKGIANFQRSDVGQLFADAALTDLVRELTGSMDGLGLGITLASMKAAAGGEASWSIVPVGPKTLAHLFTLDVTGKATEARKLLDDVAARMKKLGYAGKSQNVAGVPAEVWTGPKGEVRVVLLHADLLVCADQVGAVEDVVTRWQSGSKGGLSEAKVFVAARSRVEKHAKGPGDLFLFVDPLTLAQAQRLANALPPRTRDPIAIFKAEGFDAIQGIATIVNFATAPYEALFHVAIHAPPPYHKAMRSLRLLPTRDFTVPTWVSGEVGEWGTFSFDHDNAFVTVGPLIDQLLLRQKPGTFDRIMADLRDEKHGPRVDVRKEVLGRLSHRLTVITDTDPKTEGTLVAAEVKESAAVARALERLFAGEEDTKRRQVGRWELWEFPPRRAKGKTSTDFPGGLPPTEGVSVANGMVYFATNVRLLEKVLTQEGGGLARTQDCARVTKELERMVPAEVVMRWFARPDRTLRGGYETLRQGEGFASNSPAALLMQLVLRGVKGEGLDRKKLPAFEKLTGHLGPAGMYLVTSEEGWVLTGFTLKK